VHGNAVKEGQGGSRVSGHVLERGKTQTRRQIQISGIGLEKSRFGAECRGKRRRASGNIARLVADTELGEGETPREVLKESFCSGKVNESEVDAAGESRFPRVTPVKAPDARTKKESRVEIFAEREVEIRPLPQVKFGVVRRNEPE